MVKVHIELPSLRKTKQQIFLYICIICILFFLNRIIHNVNDYNKFLLSIKEYEQLNTNISSYLWLPTTRNSSNVKPNTTNTNSSSTTTKTKTILETNNNNTTTTTTQNNNKQIFAINSHTTTTTKIKKDYSNSSKYWNYDDAAPPIQYGTTHILKSLPTKHRITQLAITNLTNYLLQPTNIFPNKMHWFEFNPSITILPNRYRIPINNTTTSSSKTPIYLASYRFTYRHGCFPYEQRALMYNFQKKDKKMKQQVPNDAYIGFALLDSELSILFDVVIIVKKKSQLSNSYKIDGSMADYRVFTIHDQLYFTSKSMIGRLEIRSGMSSSSSSSNNEEGRAYQYNIPTTTNNINNLDQDYVQLQHVQDDDGTDDDDTTSTTKQQQFTVYLQRQPSCFSYYDKNEKDGSKNILYFVDNNNNTMAEYFPSKPNNSVRSVDLTKPCNPRPTTQQRPQQQQQQQQQPDEVSSSSTNNNNNQTTSSSTGAQKQQQQTTTTFKNFHEQKYPQFPKKNGKHNTQSFLTGDRGSGCCIRLEHPTTKQEYLVGIIHPKTPYPGKFLPSGVLPNIYLSRFFAMEPFPPYNIVVRTGTFCFGFSSSQELFSHKLIWKERSDFMFMDDTGFKCPRIHFVMSIIDNVVNPDQVIISYGIGDCLPRMIIVDKVDIQAMLWPSSSLPTTNNTNTITKK